ncbi:spermidine/putrescine ABC transporter ATP-binding protein [Bacillus tropicus]|nr:spermidine/putrescine ABC transporter ATP-binding protein [Bacillus tropicus]
MFLLIKVSLYPPLTDSKLPPQKVAQAKRLGGRATGCKSMIGAD